MTNDGVRTDDRYLRAEAIDDLLAYFGGEANKFRKPAARKATTKLTEYGGFIPYVYYELDELEQASESKVVPITKPKEESPLLGGAKVSLNIDWEQYKRDAEYSKSHPLPRRVIPISNGIEVFGLPGFEKKRGRYLLSQTNAAEAVGKDRSSMLHFLTSKTLKVLLGSTVECCNFNAENVQNSIVGIPPEIANLYWIHQLSKGNLQA
jgi:hypothetical protein